MRFLLDILYLVALVPALPVWLVVMIVTRARRYRVGIPQRFGLAPVRPAGTKRLWVHAVSVGEAGIVSKLVAAFREQHPDWEVVFSTFTDTGADRLRSLYPGSPVFYFPLDLSPCARMALRRVKPTAVVLVEQELWPNFLDGCRARRVPVAVVNGRMNPSSARRLRLVTRVLRRFWEPVRLCCARSDEDAERFVAAGLPAERVRALRSLKYDSLPLEIEPGRLQALREAFAMEEGAPVLVAGSLFADEDGEVCEVYARLRERRPDLRLIAAPKHIEHGAALARTAQARGPAVVRKSEIDAGRATAKPADVVVLDTIGDLGACYGLASCVFVGRSLHAPGGGQNMMEPAGLGRPTVVGPHTGHFRPEMALLEAGAGVLVVADAAELEREIDHVLSDPAFALALAERGRDVILAARGATDETLALLDQMLDACGLAN